MSGRTSCKWTPQGVTHWHSRCHFFGDARPLFGRSARSRVNNGKQKGWKMVVLAKSDAAVARMTCNFHLQQLFFFQQMIHFTILLGSRNRTSGEAWLGTFCGIWLACCQSVSVSQTISVCLARPQGTIGCGKG